MTTAFQVMVNKQPRGDKHLHKPPGWKSSTKHKTIELDVVGKRPK